MVGIARELNSMLFATAVALLLFLEQGLCQQQPQYRGGMGSHSHMKNSYHGGHSHHRPKLPTEDIPQAQQVKPQKMTKDRDLIRDKEHIKEELAEFLKDKDVSQMSNHELEFHYFKMHDTDGNNKLDGLELLAALLHVHEDDDEEEEVDEEAKIAEFRASPDDPPEVKEEKKRKSGEYYRLKSEKRRKAIEAFRFYTKMIDEVLEEDDYNRDGYLNYVEFAASRRRDEEIEKKNTDYSWF